MANIMIITGIGCNFLFNFWIVRYSILLVLSIIAVVKRKALMELVKGIRNRKTSNE